MKLAKATAIAFFLVMGAALVVLSANAQQPPATPAASPAPRSARWATLHCDALWAAVVARRQMTPDQLRRVQPFGGSWTNENNLWHECYEASPPPSPRETYPSPYNKGPFIELTPLPPPPTPISAADPPFGPSGVSFAGAEVSACTTVPNQPPQPPDVAADVSSTQNVELLNQGLWIFNKNGKPDTADCPNETATAPCESLYQFWCPSGASQPLPGCGSPILLLTDTQIAWDPIDKVWLATTMALNQNNKTATLYFAYSTTANAADTAGNWLRWSTSLCGGNFPDEPVLGFGQNWAVIDTQCRNISAQNVADTITLVPNSDITGHTFNPTNPNTSNLPSDVFTWRPSRDISASGFGYVYLVASVVTGSIAPYALISSIDPLGNVATPTSLPGMGNSTDSYTLPLGAQGTCTNPSSGCGIDIGDAHIRQAPVLQYDPGNKDHYLLASFAAGDGSSGADSLYYFLQVENNTVASEIIGSSSYILAYPTIVADQDQDFYLTTTSFAGGSPIYSSWYASHGFLTIEAQGYLQTSAGNSTYTGDQSCGGTGNPRWGDYMSTVWDSSQTSVGGEKDAFWSVQEFTAGVADQSTEWLQLNDPLPYFVGSNNKEAECSTTPGNCHVTIGVPSGVQNGDLILVAGLIGEPATELLQVPDSSWTLLSASNISGSPKQIASKNPVARGLLGSLHIFSEVCPMIPAHMSLRTTIMALGNLARSWWSIEAPVRP